MFPEQERRGFTHQQVQGALAGQGIALARIALVHDLLERGELVELFDGRFRLATTATYYLIQLPLAPQRPELTGFVEWVARSEDLRLEMDNPSYTIWPGRIHMALHSPRADPRRLSRARGAGLHHVE